MYFSADMGNPKLTIDPLKYEIIQKDDSLFCNDSYLRYDSCGLWELIIKGSGQERGAKQGALTSKLMKYQEDVFVNQIRTFIPSDNYLGFLRNLIIIFNRNLGKYIPIEYRDEIAAMAEFCTTEYNAIGTSYERQLNYHAAHDIGHTMQQYMLVGCTSFGVWEEKSEDHSLIIGRNFDFFVGDDFAKNKLITFAVPDFGYRYASVGWAGMIGVLSGMNETGLTVTINAAKGAIPTSAAMPISILTREILQYASTIDEAFNIAQMHKTFVSESILIGSLKDGKCAIIEKTPDKIALFQTNDNYIICTNHFQADDFKNDDYNVENINNSDSKYRYDRVSELLEEYQTINYHNSADILRNRYGLQNEDIGIGNEMTINQSIAHHAVIFMPEKKLMWMSTSPWQSGKIVCYNLDDFFNHNRKPGINHTLCINEDSVFIKQDLDKLMAYRNGIYKIKTAIKQKTSLDEAYMNEFISSNPKHYYVYFLSGDYYASKDNKEKAISMYSQSLNCSVPNKTEIEEIKNKINKLTK